MADELIVAETGTRYEFDPLSNQVIGSAIEVHRTLGPAGRRRRERLYENALCVEMDRRGLNYRRQLVIPVHYGAVSIGAHRIDLVVGDELVVEVKAVSQLIELYYAQLAAYLRAANARVGLLLNFGELRLGIKRIVNNYPG